MLNALILLRTSLASIVFRLFVSLLLLFVVRGMASNTLVNEELILMDGSANGLTANWLDGLLDVL